MQYDKIQKTLTAYVEAGNTKSAVAFVSFAYHHEESEQKVKLALYTKNRPQEVIDAALERFIKTRQRYDHGGWVHSLSHFTPILWELKLKDWIRRLNEVAFTGANETGETSCSDRLINDFSQFASWNDVPAEYGYTPLNLLWVEDKESYQYRYLLAAPFKSEVAKVRFSLERMFVTYTPWVEGYGQATIIDVKHIRKTVTKLSDLGDDTTDLADFESLTIRKFIAKCEQKLKTAAEGVEKKELEKSIKSSHEMLAMTTT